MRPKYLLQTSPRIFCDIWSSSTDFILEKKQHQEYKIGDILELRESQDDSNILRRISLKLVEKKPYRFSDGSSTYYLKFQPFDKIIRKINSI